MYSIIQIYCITLSFLASEFKSEISLDKHRYLNLSGECIGRFTNRKIPYCVKFNPDEVISSGLFCDVQ